MGRCLQRLRSETGTIEDFELEIDLPLLGRRLLLLCARRMRDASALAPRILLAIDDVTEHNLVNHTLALARSQVERANRGRSLFLAAPSHDLRPPLQTLSLLQGILLKRTKDPTCLQLTGRIDETLGVMSDMLHTLLDINQLEAGIVRPEVSWLPLTYAVSSLYHSMGQPDRYPFVVAPAVMRKLRFIHDLVHRDGDGRPARARSKSPAY